MIVGLLGSMSGDTGPVFPNHMSYDSELFMITGYVSYNSGPVGIYVMCTVIIYRIFEMIGWRSNFRNMLVSMSE